MAMSFAPLSLKIPLQIKDYKVVSKSYPNFWKDLVKLNFIIDNEIILYLLDNRYLKMVYLQLKT